jgi:hypothetical protein
LSIIDRYGFGPPRISSSPDAAGPSLRSIAAASSIAINCNELTHERREHAGAGFHLLRDSPTGHRRRTPRKTRVIVADRFAVCVRNDDYPASLELRKLYPIVEDDFAEQHDLLRVIDESDDYLYPNTCFVRLELPKPIERILQRIA